MAVGSDKKVVCKCNGVKEAGTFTVHGRFLTLTSPLGTTTVLVGLQKPRRLAARLLKNACLEATAPVEPGRTDQDEERRFDRLGGNASDALTPE